MDRSRTSATASVTATGGGHVVDVQQLVGADPQRVAVDGRHPVERPALGVRREQLVDPGAVLGDAADQGLGVGVGRALALGDGRVERLDRVLRRASRRRRGRRVRACVPCERAAIGLRRRQDFTRPR